MLAREHARREHGLTDAAPEQLWARRAHAELLRLSACHNLGLTLNDAGERRAEAAAHVSTAHAGFEQLLGPTHPNTLKALHNMGMLAAAQAPCQLSRQPTAAAGVRGTFKDGRHVFRREGRNVAWECEGEVDAWVGR